VRSILTVVAVAAVMGGVALAQAQSGEVYQIGNGVTSPVLVKEVKPTYPEAVKSRRVQGVVELSAVVLPDGTIGDDIKVARSLDEDLDKEAVKAIRQWTFRPGTKDGKAVAVQVNIELSFTLK
jgi:periplasmic protein TonB